MKLQLLMFLAFVSVSKAAFPSLIFSACNPRKQCCSTCCSSVLAQSLAKYSNSSKSAKHFANRYGERNIFWDMGFKTSIERAEYTPEKFVKRYYKLWRSPLDEYAQLQKSKYDNTSKPDLPNTTGFFLYSDLSVGKTLRPHMTKPSNMARILPHKLSEAIPFSVSKLREILKRFSVDTGSPQADLIKQTVEFCHSGGGIPGETRFCAKSLESIVDFCLRHVGNNPKVVMTEVEKPAAVQDYNFTQISHVGDEHVVCHKQRYPYAVYMCHTLLKTKVFQADMVGADGARATAAVICHFDTSNWIPQYPALVLLHQKPGEGTICHFVRSDTVVFASGAK